MNSFDPSGDIKNCFGILLKIGRDPIQKKIIVGRFIQVLDNFCNLGGELYAFEIIG